MEVLNLSVTARANTRGALKSGRKSDLVPRVIYGNGSEGTLLFLKVLREKRRWILWRRWLPRLLN